MSGHDIEVADAPAPEADSSASEEAIEQAARADMLKRRRVLDLASARELLARGWRQSAMLDGLRWCATCGQPTVWTDPAGHPRHHTCTDLF